MQTTTTQINVPVGLSPQDENLWYLEEEARRKSRAKLLHFVKKTMPHYRINWHHRIIADAFERFARREAMRVIIVAPPRTGKSQLVSRHGPAWLLGNYPDARVICTSHTANLAADMSSDVRKIMIEPDYHDVFPEARVAALRQRGEDVTGVKDRSDQWDLIGRRGGMKAVGRGGGLAGFDADYAIIDDPFKNRKEAKSKVIRDEAWDWFNDDVLMRLGNSGPCLIMHTRWDEDDIIGRIEEQMRRDPDAEQWEIIYLPAEMDEDALAATYPAPKLELTLEDGATPLPVRMLKHPMDPRKVGEPLWPWYYGGKKDGQSPEERAAKCAAYFKRWKKNPIGWASLGQQRPQPAGTKLFPVEKIDIVKAVDRKVIRSVRYWDNAGTKDAGCYTAGVKVSLLAGEGPKYLIEHVERFQEAALIREAKKKATAKRDGIRVRQVVEQEPGSAGKDVAEQTQRNMSGLIVNVDKVTGSKELRAEVAATAVQGGDVMMLEGIWNQDLLDELKVWPNGPYRDQGDALSGAIAKLAGKTYNAEAMGAD